MEGPLKSSHNMTFRLTKLQLIISDPHVLRDIKEATIIEYLPRKAEMKQSESFHFQNVGLQVNGKVKFANVLSH